MTDRGAVQLDFGGFDSKFLGVTIRVASQQAVDVVINGREGRPLVDEAISTLDPERAFELLALLSVRSHEHRHFHDFLLSPFGSYVLRRRLSALVNVRQLQILLHADPVRGDANTLPVPLAGWCSLPGRAREVIVAGWDHHYGGRHAVPDLPEFADEASATDASGVGTANVATFHRLVRAAAKQYEGLQDLYVGDAGAVHYVHVAEASALAIQCSEVWRSYGQRAVDLLLDELFDRRDTPYGRALWLFSDALTADGSLLSMRQLSVVATWCQLGNPLRYGEDAGAVGRFVRVAELLAREGYPQVPLDRFAFEHWDERLGYAPTLAGLVESLDDDDGFTTQLVRLREQAAPADAPVELLDDTLRWWEEIRLVRRACVERFVRAPELYTAPGAYLDLLDLEVEDALPAPPVLVKVLGGGIDNRHGTVEASGYTGGSSRSPTCCSRDESPTRRTSRWFAKRSVRADTPYGACCSDDGPSVAARDRRLRG